MYFFRGSVFIHCHAGCMELVPLLLQPADLELLQQQQQQQQQPKQAEQASNASAGQQPPPQQQQQSRQPADEGCSSESSVCKALEVSQIPNAAVESGV